MGDRPGDGPPAFTHEPVMVEEITDLFGPVPAGTVADATVGGGGHSRALLGAHPHLSVIGLDRDPVAVEAAGALARDFPGRVVIRRSRFDQLPSVMSELGIPHLSGALFDLGVSSPQLDVAGRGFSFRVDGPLDMRMDPSQTLTAWDVVNTTDPDELAALLRENADERHAWRIARAIVAARPIEGTARLAEVVRAAIPAATRRHGGHPATRTFQAIRIEVNGELALIEPALRAAIDALVPGGRIAVLSYHSGEDRRTKAVLRDAERGGCTCPPRLPCACGARPLVRLLGRGSRTPSAAEVAANPRAASARLRAAEKLEVAA